VERAKTEAVGQGEGDGRLDRELQECAARARMASTVCALRRGGRTAKSIDFMQREAKVGRLGACVLRVDDGQGAHVG